MILIAAKDTLYAFESKLYNDNKYPALSAVEITDDIYFKSIEYWDGSIFISQIVNVNEIMYYKLDISSKSAYEFKFNNRYSIIDLAEHKDKKLILCTYDSILYLFYKINNNEWTDIPLPSNFRYSPDIYISIYDNVIFVWHNHFLYYKEMGDAAWRSRALQRLSHVRLTLFPPDHFIASKDSLYIAWRAFETSGLLSIPYKINTSIDRYIWFEESKYIPCDVYGLSMVGNGTIISLIDNIISFNNIEYFNNSKKNISRGGVYKIDDNKLRMIMPYCDDGNNKKCINNKIKFNLIYANNLSKYYMLSNSSGFYQFHNDSIDHLIYMKFPINIYTNNPISEYSTHVKPSDFIVDNNDNIFLTLPAIGVIGLYKKGHYYEPIQIKLEH